MSSGWYCTTECPLVAGSGSLTTWTSQVRPWPCSPLLSVSGVQMVEVTPTTGYQLVHCQMSSDERLPRPAHWMVGAGYKKICGAPLTGEQDMARVRMRAWKTLTRSGRLDCPGCQGGGALLVGHILEGVTLSHCQIARHNPGILYFAMGKYFILNT